MNKLTNIEFIDKANKVHKNKYDYSKCEYINSRTKVCIICPEHGEFWQTPNNHLKGKGCPKCKSDKLHILKTMGKDEFIKKAKSVHNNKYDYSKVEYVNNSTKVCIICPEHGEFWQAPNNHLNGNGCIKCVKHSYQYGIKRTHKTNEEVIKEFKNVHGEKYDYSKVDHVNVNTKICIICPKHGEFWQTPHHHLRGQGCPICANENKRLTLEEFVNRANKIHNNKYNYSMVHFTNVRDYIDIICSKHGVFRQNVMTHLRGHGCQCCNASFMEKNIQRVLDKNNINYVYQCDYKKLKWLGKQTLDFYLPDYNIAIECQGEQHYKVIDFSGKNIKRAEKEYEDTVERDRRKLNLCNSNGVILYYFTKKKFVKNIDNAEQYSFFFNEEYINEIIHKNNLTT